MFIVDAQIHLWRNAAAPKHHRSAPYLVQEAVQAMDAAGVARAINCPAIWDPDANAYAQDAVAAYPDRMATMGWVPLDMAADALALERFLAQPGMLGLRFVIMWPKDVEAFQHGEFDWIWAVADRLAKPVALMVPKPLLPAIGVLAERFPNIRFLIDHLAIGPFDTMPAAAEGLDALIALAAVPTIAVKATGTPGFSAQPYPYADVSPVIERVFDAFGPARLFWGTDISRMPVDLARCVEMFTHHLPWLRGDDRDAVMGRSVCEWVGWPIP